MVTKMYPDGKMRNLRSMRDVMRNLWQVRRVSVWLTNPSETAWMTFLYCNNGVTYITNWTDPEQVWDWLNRSVLAGVPIFWNALHATMYADPKARGKYPWK